MTEHERELIRLMYELRNEESRNQSRLITTLRDSMDRLRDSIEHVERMQMAQNQMLKIIADLLELEKGGPE
jgi:hypothetical protein